MSGVHSRAARAVDRDGGERGLEIGVEPDADLAGRASDGGADLRIGMLRVSMGSCNRRPGEE